MVFAVRAEPHALLVMTVPLAGEAGDQFGAALSILYSSTVASSRPVVLVAWHNQVTYKGARPVLLTPTRLSTSLLLLSYCLPRRMQLRSDAGISPSAAKTNKYVV